MLKAYLLRLMAVCVGLIILLIFVKPAKPASIIFYFSLIKVDWLAVCIGPRVVGAVFVVFLRRWRKIFTIRQPMESKGRYRKKG
jgi:hypothetical protein